MISISVDSRAMERELGLIAGALSDGRIPLRRFYQWFRAECLRAWNNVRAEGGDFRGKRWRAMKAQYFRRTDSVTVPAWGGVKRIREGFKKAARWHSDVASKKTFRRGVSTGERMSRTTGNVSGKLRRSGTRVTRTSIIGKDTGEFATAVFPSRPDITKERLRLGGNLKEYQLAQALLRPLLFFLPSDEAMLARIAEEYAKEVIAKAQGGQRAA